MKMFHLIRRPTATTTRHLTQQDPTIFKSNHADKPIIIDSYALLRTATVLFSGPETAIFEGMMGPEMGFLVIDAHSGNKLQEF